MQCVMRTAEWSAVTASQWSGRKELQELAFGPADRTNVSNAAIVGTWPGIVRSLEVAAQLATETPSVAETSVRAAVHDHAQGHGLVKVGGHDPTTDVGDIEIAIDDISFRVTQVSTFIKLTFIAY